MDTAVLPEAKQNKEGWREKIQTGKRRKRERGRASVFMFVCVCVRGGSVDCPLALSGACAHSAWHPAYSAPHEKSPHSTQK